VAEDRTWYDVLGVTPSAGKGEVKGAYQSSLEAAEQAGNTDEVAQVRRAWQVLSDPIQRQRYDEAIVRNGRGASGTTGSTEPGEYHGDIEIVDDDDSDVEILDDELAPGPNVRRPKPSMMLETAAFLELPTLGRRLTASFVDVVTITAVLFSSIMITFQITGADSGIPGIATLAGVDRQAGSTCAGGLRRSLRPPGPPALACWAGGAIVFGRRDGQ
jgi:hypothetical protein